MNVHAALALRTFLQKKVLLVFVYSPCPFITLPVFAMLIITAGAVSSLSTITIMFHNLCRNIFVYYFILSAM